jgi:hypothetical protein
LNTERVCQKYSDLSANFWSLLTILLMLFISKSGLL